MAEALAVVGVVANIVQLVDFGTKVLLRLNEFQSSAGEIPKTFQHIKAELPVLLDTLEQTKSAIEAGSIRDKTKRALLPAVDGCRTQIESLNNLIGKVLPLAGDSWGERSRKSLSSIRQDAKVRKIRKDLQGYIQTLTYYHAATSSTLRSLTVPLLVQTPSSTVPFRRDQDFVDRDILSEIDQRCSQPASRVALVGLGGVGKSQLAIEFSYRVREKSPETWVFWVHAGTTARFEEGYRKIVERVKVPGWDKPEADILQLASNWLCDEANGHWVMIIDNADDTNVFSHRNTDNGSAQTAPSISDFLPQSTNGSILITSRSREVALRLTGRNSDIVKIEPMNQHHALALLFKKLPSNLDRTDSVELVQSLDYMPLAIAQAAGYISERIPRIGISRYLHDLRRSDKDREILLKKDVGDNRRDSRALNSIIATWQISFEHIRKERSSAARLLSLMSLFDRQGIPDTLLPQSYIEEGDIEANFEDDISTLTSYSLITINAEGNEFEMHRLIQFSTKKWLELNNELEEWKEKYIHIMDEVLPIGLHENWATCGQLFPHAEMVLSYRPINENCLAQWSSVLFKAAWYSAEKGNYPAAENMDYKALEGREIVLGKEHPETLTSVSNLALVLWAQGKYEQAEEMNRRALEGREKALGKEHPETLTSVSNLALVLRAQGKYEQAEEMNRRALEGREKALGKEHPSTLTSVSNLAAVLRAQGKYEQAEEMNRRALEGREKALGKEHPETLTSVSNLAAVLRAQGKYEQAEEMNRRALEGREKALGKEHPSTLTSVSNLAAVLWAQGKYKQAEEMNRRALEGREKALGKEHPSTLMSVSNLVYLLQQQEQCDEALVLYQRACAGYSKTLGLDHPTTKASLKQFTLLQPPPRPPPS